MSLSLPGPACLTTPQLGVFLKIPVLWFSSGSTVFSILESLIKGRGRLVKNKQKKKGIFLFLNEMNNKVDLQRGEF